MKVSFFLFLLLYLFKKIKLNKIIKDNINLKNNEFYFINPFILINNGSILNIEISYINYIIKENEKEKKGKLENYLILESQFKDNNINLINNPSFFIDKNKSANILNSNKKDILLKNISFYYKDIDLNNKNNFRYEINFNGHPSIIEDKFYFILFYNNSINEDIIDINIFIELNQFTKYNFPLINNVSFIISLFCLIIFLINIIYLIYYFKYKNKTIILNKSNYLILIITDICYFLHILLFLIFNKIYNINNQFAILLYYISNIFIIIVNSLICFYFFLISIGFSLNLQNKIFKIKNNSNTIFEQLKNIKYQKFKNFILLILINSIVYVLKVNKEIKYYIKGNNDSIIILYRNVYFFLSLIIWDNIYKRIKKKKLSINTIMSIKLYFQKALFNSNIIFLLFLLEYIFLLFYKWNKIFSNISLLLYILISKFKYLYLAIILSYIFINEPKKSSDNINIQMYSKKNNKGKIIDKDDFNTNNNYELVDNIISNKFRGIKSE